MRILHVIRGLANSSGTTHIVGPLSEAQAHLGHDVSVFFVDKPPFEAVRPRADLVRSEEFPVDFLRKHPGVSFAFARALAAQIRQFDILHVHAVWNFPSACAMREAARLGVPYMVAPQGSLEPWALASGSALRRAYVANVEGPLIRRATRMQALTDNEAEQFRQFGYRGPISIIPNGVSPDWLDIERGSLAQELRLGEDARTLLFLSRVHPKKGLDLLLRAFALFTPAAPDVTLIVAGHDAGSGYLDQMRKLAHELKIEEKCRFIGEVSGERKRRVLAGADAFALTSHSEGLPVAVVEAMSAATPVLITPGCNVPDVRTADAGLIVAPEVNEIANGLANLFLDGQGLRRRGENARRLAANHFTWPLIAQRTVEAYHLMTQARGTAV